MKLTIPSPCSENWDAMTPTACGRFCAACQKEVIDVTKMDDDTILQKYTDNNGNLCIRAREEQVTRVIPVQTFPMQRLAVFALAVWLVFAGGLVSEVQAQIETLTTKKIEIPDEMLYSSLTVRVVDENNQPVDSAEVNIRGLNLTRLTDQDGYATFEQVKAEKQILVAIKNIQNVGVVSPTLELGCHNYVEIMLDSPKPRQERSESFVHTVGALSIRTVVGEIGVSYGDKSPNRIFDNNGNVILEQYKIR